MQNGIQLKLKDVMTADPACRETDTTLVEVARLLIDDTERRRPIGITTDREIARDALNLTASGCMSSP